MAGETHCPLCGSENGISGYFEDARRPYVMCGCCGLVFVPPAWHLDREAERAEYLLHENDPGDEGYRQFLSRLAEPLLERLSPGASGLDFGCGEGPALAAMLRECGLTVALYDSFFFPTKVFSQSAMTSLPLPRWWSTCTSPVQNWRVSGVCCAPAATWRS